MDEVSGSGLPAKRSIIATNTGKSPPLIAFPSDLPTRSVLPRYELQPVPPPPPPCPPPPPPREMPDAFSPPFSFGGASADNTGRSSRQENPVGRTALLARRKRPQRQRRQQIAESHADAERLRTGQRQRQSALEDSTGMVRGGHSLRSAAALGSSGENSRGAVSREGQASFSRTSI